MKTELVFVVLGIPENDGDPMPATIQTWRAGKRRTFQHLSPEQLDEMGDDQTAIWEAEFVEGHWWLERRARETEDAVAMSQEMTKPVQFEESEIPF